ncbi:MAG: hypothetical protein JW880_01205 [Candidatus Thermoplasmatota archaeon]|nr:hypothetical protein [Candidatus Thermoplasmatota archaeon]
MRSRAILVGLVALLTVASAFAVMPVMPAQAASDANRLYLAMQEDVPDFNTYNLGSNSVWKSNVINWGFEALAGLDYNMLPFELLAEHWYFDPVNLNLTIYLRQGVMFHDHPEWGYEAEEMTADDVVFCYHAARHGTTLSSNLINAFDADDNGTVEEDEIQAAVWKIDKYTVGMQMAKPYGQFFTSTLGLYIMPKTVWTTDWNGDGHPDGIIENPGEIDNGTYDVTWDSPLATISTGAYMYKEGIPDTYRLMVRNEDYWGKTFQTPSGRSVYPANVHELYYKIYASIDTAILALQAGDIDHIMWAITAGRVPSLSADPNIKLEYLEENGYYYLAYNQKLRPMNVIKFRQAIAHLIDKKNVVDVYMGGFGAIGTASEPPYWGAWSNETVTTYPYDDPFDAATTLPETLLEQAGLVDANDDGWRDLPDGSPMEKIVILTPPADYDPIRIRAGQAIAKNMRQVGINAEAKAIDFDTLVARMNSMDFQMLIIGWSLSSDPVGNVFDILGPKSASNTFGFWTDEDPNPFYAGLLGVSTLADDETQALALKVEELGKKARESFVIQEQISYTRWAQGILAEALPVDVIYYRVNIMAYTTRWTGYLPFLGDLIGPGSNIYSLCNLQLSGAAGPAGGATQTVNLGISMPSNVGVGNTASGHVIAIDNTGAPVSGATVTLSTIATDGGTSTVSVSPASGATNAQGVLAFTVTGTGSGYSYVNASTAVGSVTSEDSATIVSVQEVPETVYLSVTPVKQVLAPGETTVVNLRVIDEEGDPVEGANVTIDPNLISYGGMAGGATYVHTAADGTATMTYEAPATIVDLNTHLPLTLSFAIDPVWALEEGYQWSNAAAANLMVYNAAAPDWVMTRVQSVTEIALDNAGNETTIAVEVVDDSGALLPDHRLSVAYSDESMVFNPVDSVLTDGSGVASFIVQLTDMADSGALKVTIGNTSVLNSVSASVTLTFVGTTPPADEMYGGYITFTESAQFMGPLGSVEMNAWVWDSAGDPADVNASLVLGATPYGTLTWSDDIYWDSTWDYLGMSIQTFQDDATYATSGPINTVFDLASWETWGPDGEYWMAWDWDTMTGVSVVGGQFTTTIYGINVAHIDQIGGIWLVPEGIGYFNETSYGYQVDGQTSIVSEYVIGRSYHVVAATFEIEDPILMAELTDYETTEVTGVVRDENNAVVENAGFLVYENGMQGNRQYGVYPNDGSSRWSVPDDTNAAGEGNATITAIGYGGAVTPSSIRADVYVKAVLEGAVPLFAQTHIFIFVKRTFCSIGAIADVQDIGMWNLNVSAKVVDFAGDDVPYLGIDLTADPGSVYDGTPMTNDDGVGWFHVDTEPLENTRAAFMTVQLKTGGAGYDLSLAKMKIPLRNLAPSIVATMAVGDTNTAVLSGGEVEEGQNVTISVMVFDLNNLQSARVVVDGVTTNLEILSGEVASRDAYNPTDTMKHFSAVLSDLEGGSHTIVVNATDALGVSSEQTITFTVVEPEEEGVSSLWLYLAIAGWVVAAIVIVLLVMKMRKPKAEVEMAPAEEPPKPPEAQ